MGFSWCYNSLSTLCDWIRNNIPNNSIIFVHHEDNVLLNTGVSFAIKCFGQRATFADFAFPFNESYLIEWDKRLNYHRNFNLLTLDEFISMCDSYSVTHLLRINHKNNIKNFPSIWKSEEFIIHEINQLKNIKQNLNWNLFYIISCRLTHKKNSIIFFIYHLFLQKNSLIIFFYQKYISN